MHIRHRVSGAVASMALAGGMLAVAPAAHAACYVDLIGSGYGASDACSDYAYAAYVEVGRGRVLVDVFCNGVLWHSRYQTATSGLVIYPLPNPPGCSAVLRLTSRAESSDAFGYLD